MSGVVASLHVHPPVAGEPLLAASQFDLVAEKGIQEDKRYFGRKTRTGFPGKRQVTLIEREILKIHTGAMGIADLEPGQARSNIETTGVDLVALIGSDVQVGEAVLRFVEPRDPCHKMDALSKGLRELMEDGRQGVIAMVIKSGRVRPGDAITPLQSD